MLTIKGRVKDGLVYPAEPVQGYDEEEVLITFLNERVQQPMGRTGRSWSEIEGAAAFPLAGEDAQSWVTRTRREDTERRERLLRPEITPPSETGNQ